MWWSDLGSCLVSSNASRERKSLATKQDGEMTCGMWTVKMGEQKLSSEHIFSNNIKETVSGSHKTKMNKWDWRQQKQHSMGHHIIARPSTQSPVLLQSKGNFFLLPWTSIWGRSDFAISNLISYSPDAGWIYQENVLIEEAEAGHLHYQDVTQRLLIISIFLNWHFI